MSPDVDVGVLASDAFAVELEAVVDAKPEVDSVGGWRRVVSRPVGGSGWLLELPVG
jgi:hypothetical protein